MPASPTQRVSLVVPTRRDIHAELALRICQWQRPGFTFLPWTERSTIDSIRNRIVENFLSADATHLLMIDADVVPPEHALDTLLTDDKDIVVGVVPILKRDSDGRSKSIPNVCREGVAPNGDYGLVPYTDSGLKPVDVAGTGCMLIKRSVIETLDKPLFRFPYDDRGIRTGGEDFEFCRKAKAAGFGVYADFDVICNHS